VPAFCNRSNEEEEPNSLLGKKGVSMNSLPKTDFVSVSLQRDIWAGKDINLASLLIPHYKETTPREVSIGDESLTIKSLNDRRLTRPLTINEFLMAFGKYKNIMCQAYPSRRQELDVYQDDILQMSQQYGSLSFYEYHKEFSFKSAQYLIQRGVKIDWSLRDTNLFLSIFTGQKVNACAICSSVSHNTNFCPEKINENGIQRQTNRFDREKDIRGRSIEKTRNGKQICNNYNQTRGCKFQENCYYSHICLKCRQSHPSYQCQGGGRSKAPAAMGKPMFPAN
jgi:hypothetical protein